MTPTQVQAPVVPHAAPVLVWQLSPAQQPEPAVHACPIAAQLAASQLPEMLPAGTMHDRPAQQSTDAVHTAPCG
jgi:hypothetical protein